MSHQDKSIMEVEAIQFLFFFPFLNWYKNFIPVLGLCVLLNKALSDLWIK